MKYETVKVMERTGTVLLFKIDIALVVIGMVLMLLTIVIKGAKK